MCFVLGMYGIKTIQKNSSDSVSSHHFRLLVANYPFLPVPHEQPLLFAESLCWSKLVSVNLREFQRPGSRSTQPAANGGQQNVSIKNFYNRTSLRPWSSLVPFICQNGSKKPSTPTRKSIDTLVKGVAFEFTKCLHDEPWKDMIWPGRAATG